MSGVPVAQQIFETAARGDFPFLRQFVPGRSVFAGKPRERRPAMGTPASSPANTLSAEEIYRFQAQNLEGSVERRFSFFTMLCTWSWSVRRRDASAPMSGVPMAQQIFEVVPRGDFPFLRCFVLDRRVLAGGTPAFPWQAGVPMASQRSHVWRSCGSTDI